MYMEDTILPYIYILPIANTMPQKVNSDHPKKIGSFMSGLPWPCHIPDAHLLEYVI